MKTTTYALFVGINQYEANVVIDRMATFPALGGCVNDVRDVRDLLAKDASIDLKSMLLADHEATKANIVKAFEEHLGQAGPDDVVLFYYSGHGTVEQADTKIWTAESDGRLEGIVCYYTEGESGKFLLSDKELRYLLAELYAKTQAHIVTIFDCCHSGDNTREALGEPVIKKRPSFRGDFLTFPQR
ncbi:MAG: caspase family protein, partial [Saprospiraceae bacterium]